MITQKHLKEILDYNTETGIWTWRVNQARRISKDEIDHINGVPDDNRWCNLREATHQQNGCNRKRNENTKSGFRGVYEHTYANNQLFWIASIWIDDTYKYLGTFECRHEAALVYNHAAEKYYEKFARFNVVFA